MRYDARQRRIIARAVIQADGSLRAATRWLREHSLECPAVGNSTVARLCNDPEFYHLIAEEREALRHEEAQDRARREAGVPPPLVMPSTPSERLDFMEKAAWGSFQGLAQELSDPHADLAKRLAFWTKVQGVAGSLRRQTNPVIAGTPDAEQLVRALSGVLAEMFGQSLACEVERKVAAEFERLRRQRTGDCTSHGFQSLGERVRAEDAKWEERAAAARSRKRARAASARKRAALAAAAKTPPPPVTPAPTVYALAAIGNAPQPHAPTAAKQQLPVTTGNEMQSQAPVAANPQSSVPAARKRVAPPAAGQPQAPVAGLEPGAPGLRFPPPAAGQPQAPTQASRADERARAIAERERARELFLAREREKRALFAEAGQGVHIYGGSLGL